MRTKPMHNRHTHTNRQLLTAVLIGFVAFAFPAWGQVIDEDLKLLPSDGAASDKFGWSIAIDNGVVAVGARGDSDNGSASGSAYLFNASTGVQIAKLLPDDGATGDNFAWSIAIDNGIVAVGASGDDDNGSVSGSAYLFDASTGVQIDKLLPSDGAAADLFGQSIAIDNGIVAVGSPYGGVGPYSGSAYLFDASTGAQIAKLLPSDGAAGDWFGVSIAIDNGVVAVGADLHDDNGTNSGAVYLFNVSTGGQIAKLLPSDGAAGDRFGTSIALFEGIVAVGALFDDDNGTSSGSAYLFDASTGAQITKLLPSDGTADDQFGWSITVGSGIVAVGALQDDDHGNDSGSAWLFDATTGLEIAKFLPSEGAPADFFGASITIDNGVVAVGAVFDDDNGDISGSAYVFTVPAASCPADLNGDGEVNTQDFITFLNAWANGVSFSDWNGDGAINTRDFIAYLNDWADGCP